MTGLTDLEICKRIAEIDLECDWVVGEDAIDLVGTNTYLGAHGIPDERVEKYGEFNPLTDDALCFRLMLKHRIKMTAIDSVYDDKVDTDYVCFNDGAYENVTNTLSINESPNKAICLAIIEANKND